ncbi:hypothetical protein HPP92_003095 [Vanilla planifolia]|uniref:Uncharacterized protein n=1 Tax=Vanilla planifolia TaxID=51239 RepID=A0A835S5K5_VANPL|nr:hypothetical protein HPP92_003095 [Vanilla planifolia]
MHQCRGKAYRVSPGRAQSWWRQRKPCSLLGPPARPLAHWVGGGACPTRTSECAACAVEEPSSFNVEHAQRTPVLRCEVLCDRYYK